MNCSLGAQKNEFPTCCDSLKTKARKKDVVSQNVETTVVFSKQSSAATCFNYGSVVHEDDHVGSVHKLDAVGAEDSGLPFEELQDAFLHQVFSHICVDRCKRIIQQVDLFVLMRRPENRWRLRWLQHWCDDVSERVGAS